MLRRRQMGSRSLRALIALAALSVLGLCGTAPAAQAVPAKFWGVVPQSLPEAEQLTRLKRGGVDSIRISIPWGQVQTQPGAAPDWSGVDPIVGRATLAGIEILPYVYGAPAWAVPQAIVPGTRGLVSAARNLPARGSAATAWTSFLQLAVGRYGPNGSFWAENPTIPKRPLRTWQIWNEPNFKYFVVRPNPAEYGQLVKISSSAIKSVDRGAQILLAGLFARPKEAEFKVKPPQAYFATDFLDQMYKRTPGVKSKFDGVALHPYTKTFKNLTADIDAVKAVLKAHGDAVKPLWITEITWSSQPPAANNSFAKGPQGQVTQLKGAFSLFKAQQAKWRLKRVYWFSIEDAPPGSCNFCDGSGLFKQGFFPKPSWSAYVKFAGGRL
jgi:Glycosyl hydrolase catalytic core